MKLKDILKGKNYKYIEYYVILPQTLGGEIVFSGLCRYMNGELISLDGDTYSLEDELIRYEVHRGEDGREILCIYQYFGEEW